MVEGRRATVAATVAVVVVGAGVFAENAYARVGARGPQFSVSASGAYYHGTPNVTDIRDGGFVVVWAGFVEGTRSVDVFGQRFNNDGSRVGTIFQVNTPNLNQEFGESAPDIAAIANGRIATAWTALKDDGDGLGVFARVLDVTDVPAALTPEIQVNMNTAGDQFLHSLAATPDGEFIITWVEAGELGLEAHRILAQRFSAQGERIGEPLEVPGTGTQFEPTVPEVDARSDGGFVVTWSSNLSQDGEGQAVLARLFSADDSASGPEFLVNVGTVGNQLLPDIAVQPDDSFVVTWMDQQFTSDRQGIVARRFDTTDALAGPEFLVSESTTTKASAPTIDAFADGSFVVVWTDDGLDGDGYGVVARRFKTSGEPDGSAFVVNTYTAGSQRLSARDSTNVAVISPELFVVVWDGEGPESRGSGVFGRMYCILANDASGCGDVACPPVATSGGVTATDALGVLAAAVGIEDCPRCVCDVNNSKSTTATDALLVLQKSVGQTVSLTCPPCA